MVVHLVLRNEAHLLSVILARKQPGILQIASFESRDHLVYFIANLHEDANLRQMLALAPAMQEYLKKIEL